MRAALIDPSLFTLPYDVELAAGLEAAGYQVTLHGRDLRAGEVLAAPITLRPDFYRFSERGVGTALPGPVRLLAKGLDHAGSLLRLMAQLRRHTPDVIHFQWLALPMFDRLALSALRRIAPLVLTVHDTNPFNGDPSAGLQLRGFRSCLQQFDALIVHTEQGRQRLQKFGIEARRISVIAHGLLHKIRAAAPETQDDRLTFLLFGKIKPYKGTDVAIAAFAALPEALRRRARLRIIGRPYMDMAPLHRAAEGLGGSVSIETDFVAEADIASLYDQNTVALFPYREIEASGVLFITLAFGRPIIASRLGSFAEILQDRHHGCLLPPGDAPALTAAMARMITDPSFVASAAQAAQALAVTVPSWEAIGGSTAQLYARLKREHTAIAWRPTRAEA